MSKKILPNKINPKIKNGTLRKNIRINHKKNPNKI